MIHYLPGKVKDSFWKQSKDFLKNHTKVWVIVGESKSMVKSIVAVGAGVDFVTSSLTKFVGTPPQQLSDHSIDMNGIICSTIYRTTLQKTPCWSSKMKNCPWFETEDKVKVPVLPWVSISRTNCKAAGAS